MIADEYAFQGYPISEIKTRYGLKQPYKLEEYEQSSINEIKKLILKKKCYRDPEIAEQHLVYLESLAKKLNMILASEEREGLLNLELKQQMAEIRSLCVELAKLYEACKGNV